MAGRSLVAGRAVITPDRDGGVRVLPDHAVLVEDGRIRAVDGAERLARAFPRVPRLGGPSALVMPGLVNAHSHGMGVSNVMLGTRDMPLELWNVLHLGRPKPPRTAETALAALRQLESGITTTVHSQAGGHEADAVEILRGYERAGIRAVLALHARNQNRIAYEADERFLARLPARLQRPLARAFPPVPPDYPRRYDDAFARLCARFESDRIRLAFGPAGVQWVDPGFLRRLARRARDEGRTLHTHLLESPHESAYGPRSLGGRTVPWLSRNRVLGRFFTGAHGVWLDGRDLATVARAGGCLVHCPSSNLRLSSGRMPLLRARAAGVTVALGTDSLALSDDDDFWCEMRLALRLHNEPGLSGRRLRAADVLRMATVDGARSIACSERGLLRRGAHADLVIVDGEAVDPLRAASGEALVDALVCRARPRDVRLVMIGGEVVMRNGRHARLSRARLERRVLAVAPGSPALVRARAELLRQVETFYAGWGLPERRRR